MARKWGSARPWVAYSKSGFTLIEILTAIVVLGVATSIIISTFLQSRDLAQSSRSRKLATTFAQEQLLAITTQPGRFDWSALKSAEAGKTAEIALVGETTEGSRVMLPPGTLPTNPRAANREEGFYSILEWRAFARRPSPEAHWVEVTVAIHWLDQGRRQSLALTSSMPAGSLEGIA
ncbi:MAG: type II secretion system protein [Candidatus Hydrogenedentes bacterium]|nr:type II secretion system protein [Candidatus Hydrogenedentota bacterium]